MRKVRCYVIAINDICRSFDTYESMMAFISEYSSKNTIYSLNMFKAVLKPLK